MEPNEGLFLLAVNRISFLKPREKVKLAKAYHSLDWFLRLSKQDLERILGRRIRAAGFEPQAYLQEAEADRKHLTGGAINCTFYWDDAFPPLLREIYDPPVLLYYRGSLPDYTRPAVAVVGTRRPSGIARSAAYALSFELAELGFSSVSGLARGVDWEAHRGSLDGGGSTIAVLGSGIDILFPGSSSPLGRRILKQGGLVVSEYPPGTPARAYHFPARNRIISGLARAVVVVQAPEKSGALITADFALQQGRDLFVHRQGLGGITGRGSLRLHQEGAPVVQGAKEILAGWHWIDPPAARTGGLGRLKTGTRLARLMELELAHQCAVHNGDFYQKRHP